MTHIEELVRDTMARHAEDAPPAGPTVERALTKRGVRPRGRIVALAALGTAASIAAAVAFGLLVGAGPGDVDSGTADSSPTQGRDVAVDVRTVEIYAAAIDRAMTEFVMGPDHPDVPESMDVAGPVDEAERGAISEAVADVTVLHWVDDLPCIECGDASRPGLRLRPIEDTSDAGRVEVDGYVMDLVRGPRMSLHTHMLGYVIEERAGTWEYAGPVPTGPPNPICDGIPAGEPRC